MFHHLKINRVLAIALLFFSLCSCKYLKAQIQWTVLRSQYVNNGQYAYYSISACDDHNFIAPAYRADSIGVRRLLIRSTDGGQTWTEQDPGLPIIPTVNTGMLYAAILLDSLHAIAIGDTSLILTTSDGGNTWAERDAGFGLSCMEFLDPHQGILCGGNGNIRTTSDGGLTWNILTNPSLNGVVSCHDYGNGRYRFFQYGSGPIYTTSDNGKSWDSTRIYDYKDPANANKLIDACDFLGIDSILAYGSILTPSFNLRHAWVLLSTDGGRSWKEQLNRIISMRGGVYSVSEAFDNIWVGGGGGDGMIYSTNHGSTWIDDSVTLFVPEWYPFQQMNTVVVVSPTRAVGVMGNDLGSYIVALDLLKLSVSTPRNDSRSINVSPNPFNDITYLDYPVESHSIVDIELVDLLGRRIKSIYLGDQEPGHYRLPITLDEQHAQGVYFVRALLDGQLVMKKIQLER
jgi:photosystem II stability/assembly factor-like uncharacterized protein